MAAPETADRVELTALARVLASDMREELLTLLREIFERNVSVERLAYSPDEAAELLGISRELVHDLLRTGQLGSVKAGRRRLIGKRHLERFLAGEQ
jgi:excisionase family DNA binding protein